MHKPHFDTSTGTLRPYAGYTFVLQGANLQISFY